MSLVVVMVVFSFALVFGLNVWLKKRKSQREYSRGDRHERIIQTFEEAKLLFP